MTDRYIGVFAYSQHQGVPVLQYSRHVDGTTHFFLPENERVGEDEVAGSLCEFVVAKPLGGNHSTKKWSVRVKKVLFGAAVKASFTQNDAEKSLQAKGSLKDGSSAIFVVDRDHKGAVIPGQEVVADLLWAMPPTKKRAETLIFVRPRGGGGGK